MNHQNGSFGVPDHDLATNQVWIFVNVWEAQLGRKENPYFEVDSRVIKWDDPFGGSSNNAILW